MDDVEIAHGSRSGRGRESDRPAEPSAAGSPGELLDPSEFDVWRVFVASSRLLLAELDRRLRHDAGIPHSWFILLVVLSERPDRTARQSDLAGITDFSLSRLSHAINRMQDKGWMYRRTDPHDRRAADVVLTPLGAAAVLDIRRGHDAALRQLFFEPLAGYDIEALRRACRALLPGLRGAPHTLAAGPPQSPQLAQLVASRDVASYGRDPRQAGGLQ